MTPPFSGGFGGFSFLPLLQRLVEARHREGGRARPMRPLRGCPHPSGFLAFGLPLSFGAQGPVAPLTQR